MGMRGKPDKAVDIMVLLSNESSLPEVTSHTGTTPPVRAQAFPPLPEDTQCPPLRQLPRKKTVSLLGSTTTSFSASKPITILLHKRPT